MRKPILYIFSGLPGTGKSTMATLLARRENCTYLRIDTVEQGIRDLFAVDIQYEGYQLTHRIAAENLAMGNSVVVDSCNPLQLTREDWQLVATGKHADFINIETICSNQSEHRRRIEERSSPVPNLQLPTWRQVQKREYHEWAGHRLVLDTADCAIEQAFARLLAMIRREKERVGCVEM